MLNFLSNAIKFTSQEGTVSINFKVKKIENFEQEPVSEPDKEQDKKRVLNSITDEVDNENEEN